MTAKVERVGLVLLIASWAGCAHSSQPQGEHDVAEQRAIADAQLGLAKVSVFTVAEPQPANEGGGEPGDNQRLPRYFDGAPPLIPHAIGDIVPITRANNGCLDCHEGPAQKGEVVAPGDPPGIPASHFTDLRAQPPAPSKTLVGARYNCTQCHVPQTDAKALVQSTYRQ